MVIQHPVPKKNVSVKITIISLAFYKNIATQRIRIMGIFCALVTSDPFLVHLGRIFEVSGLYRHRSINADFLYSYEKRQHALGRIGSD